MCRFSTAGDDDLTTRSGGRRPKSAKARVGMAYPLDQPANAQPCVIDQSNCRSPTRSYPSRCPGGSRHNKFGKETPAEGEKAKNEERPHASDQRTGTVTQCGAVRSQDPDRKPVPVP